ncbi:metalloprotease [Streptomyces sp. NRRL B-1568]|nr:metalloprotease [Streptomyces sp. NRRL B-1568]
MRIRLTRSGGFAGLTRHAELDTADHPDGAELERLATEAIAAGHPKPPSGVPDGYQYELTVDDHTAHCADPHLTDAQRQLMERLLQEGA